MPFDVALATAPVKGARYGGSYDTGSTLNFRVAESGEELTFKTTYPAATCLAPAMPPIRHAEIHDGRFTVHVGADWTVTGRFLEHGRAKGTWTCTRNCDFPVKVVNHYHGTWSAFIRASS
jgi:hypothetical protein